MKRAVVSFRMLAVGVLGGVLGVVLCRWGGYYLPETESFVSLRDLPAILLALFVGPVPAVVAGALTAVLASRVDVPGRLRLAAWVHLGGCPAFPISLTRMEMDELGAGRQAAAVVLTYLKTGTFPTGVAVQPQWCPGETF